MNDVQRHRPLVQRLVTDAEAWAAQGRVQDALVLLRWAARICEEELLAGVLLAFHRVRGGQVRFAAQTGPLNGGSSAAPALPDPRGADTAHGFPEPRFPTSAPALDLDSFVPTTTRALPGWRVAPPPGFIPEKRNATRGGTRALAAVAVAGLVLAAAPQADSLRAAARSAAVALAAGGPSHGADPQAVLRRTAGGERTPALLLARGRAFAALNETVPAIAALDSTVRHPGSSVEELHSAAELLAGLDGGEGAAADGYLRAFQAGLAREHWPAAAAALERAGHREQAARLRGLLSPERGRVGRPAATPTESTIGSVRVR